jgi:hypothetical protein
MRLGEFIDYQKKTYYIHAVKTRFAIQCLEENFKDAGSVLKPTGGLTNMVTV